MGKAAIVIPSPHVTDGHQLCNAQALADRGAALLVEETDFPCGALSRAVLQLLDDRDARRRLEKNIRAVADQDANRLIYEHIVEAVQEYQKRNNK